MATKYQLIIGLYESTVNAVTNTPTTWTAFLRSACRNYKCRFDEQILIYVQRPDAITMLDLIVSSLRFHPALIVPAEVRDAAAWEAANAGQTGHTILTAFHADSAFDAYGTLWGDDCLSLFLLLSMIVFFSYLQIVSS